MPWPFTLRDEPNEFGFALAGVLVAVSSGLFFVGAPLGRSGLPSASRFAALFAMAIAGIVAQLLVSPWVALGVAQVVLVILLLNVLRGHDAPRQRHITLGSKVVSAVSLVSVALQVTESLPLRLAIVAVGLLLTAGLQVVPKPPDR